MGECESNMGTSIFDKYTDQIIKDRYLNNESIYGIAKSYNCSRHAVHNSLKRSGVVTRNEISSKKYQKNIHVFDTIET